MMSPCGARLSKFFIEHAFTKQNCFQESAMTGDHDSGRRKQAQALGDRQSGGDSLEAGVAQGKKPAAAFMGPGAAGIHVEDLGDGRARLGMDLPWSLALKVLDFLKDSTERRSH